MNTLQYIITIINTAYVKMDSSYLNYLHVSTYQHIGVTHIFYSFFVNFTGWSKNKYRLYVQISLWSQDIFSIWFGGLVYCSYLHLLSIICRTCFLWQNSLSILLYPHNTSIKKKNCIYILTFVILHLYYWENEDVNND